MKNFLLVLTLALLSFSFAAQAQWVDISPVAGQTYNTIVVNGGNIYTAPSGNGVYLSTDEGTSWNAINTGLTDLNVSSILVAGNNLFAGVNSGKVFLSTNNGTTWTQAGALGSNGSQVKCLVTLGSYIFAGTSSNGVYRSSDNGTTWDLTSLSPSSDVRAFAVSGTNLFAGTNNNGVALSTDNGTTWNAVNSGLTNINVTGLSVSGSKLFAGTNGSSSVFLSTDNGTSWSAVSGSSQFSGWGVYVQSVATFGAKNVFAGTFLGGVYLSTDDGANWAAINTGFTGNPLVGSIAFSGTSYVYAAESVLGAPYNSFGGIWRRPLTDVITLPPSAPVLASPENHATAQQTSLVMKWNSSATATGYQCQISLDPTFATNIVINDSLLTDTTDSITGLGNSATYYWRVRAYNTGGISSFSVIDTFSTIIQAPSVPALISPANNAINQPWNNTLVCSKAAGAAQYHWQVSTTLTFSNFVVNDSTTDTTRMVTLQSGTKYYWRVQSINPGGESAFAGPDSFVVMVAPASSPILVSPLNGATYQRADTLSLVWHSTLGASGYSVQFSDTVSFTRFVVNDSTADTTCRITSLKNLKKYYWRVRGFNAGGFGSFSVADSLTTIVSVPAVPEALVPTYRAINVPRNTQFNWSVSTLANKYQLQISTSPNLYTSGDSIGAFLVNNVVIDTIVTDTSFQLSAPLAASEKYYWHVRAIDTAGISSYSNNPVSYFTTSAVDGINEMGGIPKEFALLQNYPNPFNPSTIIKYDLPKSQMVSLKIYNILGQQVATLVNTFQSAGYYSVNFNASHLSSGVYFYMLRTDSFNSIHKMLLLK